MQVFQFILFLLFIVIAFVFLYDIVKAFKESKNRTSSLKTASKYFFIAILVVVIPILILKHFGKEPELYTSEQKVEFYTKYEYFSALNQVYEGLVRFDKLNYELNFKYIDAIDLYVNKKNRYNKFNFDRYKESNTHKRIINFYTTRFNDNYYQINISKLFLALYFVNLNEIKEAEKYFEQVKTTEVPYYNYVKGKILSRSKDSEKIEEAEKSLQEARKETLGKEAAIKELARHYYFYRLRDKLKAFIYNDDIVATMPLVFFKRIVYFRNFDLKNYWKNIFVYKKESFAWFGIFSSFFILIIWLRYIRKLDVFEPESWFHTFIVLGLSMITIFLVYPYSDILRDVFGYYPSNNPIDTLLHDIIKIGVIEELVKFIPFLILLKFTKAVNEPYDYIYYMSVSALGFAFIENLGYIQDGTLYNIATRGIMPAVAHMLFSATIGYGLMLAKYKKYNSFGFFIIFFLLAATLHGFYDYWLINKFAAGYEWISIMFFIVIVHVWHIYVNNSLNISTFYNKHIKIENDTIRYELLLSLILLVMLSYLFVGLALGEEAAYEELLSTTLMYGYLIIYLAYSMSRFQVIRGYFKPFILPFNFFIPRLKKHKSNVGYGIKLTNSNRKSTKGFEKIKQLFPFYGILERRLVAAYDLECYLMVLETHLEIDGYYPDAIAVSPISENKTLSTNEKISVSIFLLKNKEVLNKPFLDKNDLIFIGYAVSQKIGKVSSEKNIITKSKN